jgi:hypothetical protein
MSHDVAGGLTLPIRLRARGREHGVCSGPRERDDGVGGLVDRRDLVRESDVRLLAFGAQARIGLLAIGAVRFRMRHRSPHLPCSCAEGNGRRSACVWHFGGTISLRLARAISNRG